AALGSGLGRSSTDTSGSQTPIDIFSGFSAPAPQRILGPATWTRRDKYRTANNPAPATTTSIRPYKSRFPLRIREKDAAPHAILLALPHPPSMVKRMPPIVTPSVQEGNEQRREDEEAAGGVPAAKTTEER
ncbi:unnamed protein product, partial [Linum tenue]